MVAARPRPSYEHELGESLPHRFGSSHATPAGLASLFLITLLGSKRPGGFRDALAERMIDLTVRRAARDSDFYAELYRGHLPSTPRTRIGLRELARLPVVQRRDIIAAGDRIHARGERYLLSTYTRGSSSGSPLVIDRSREEQRFLTRFFTALQRYTGSGGQAGMALVLATWDHGRTLTIPGPFESLPVSISRPEGLRTAALLLSRRFVVDGRAVQVSSIGGTLNTLARLTAYLRLEGQDDLAAGVTSLQSTSQYLSGHSRRDLETFWGCRLQDRFGMSELLMGAWQCPDCGWYHFEPYGVPEVLGAGGERLDAGRGRLVLTGFFPFSRMTPMIRYATGDLAELAGGVCPSGAPGYRFLGRASSSLDLTPELGAGSFLGEAELVELLDSLPEVARVVSNRNLPPALWEAGAPPAFAVHREGGRPAIRVVLRPGAAPPAQALHARLTAGLADLCPPVAPLLASRRLALELTP